MDDGKDVGSGSPELLPELEVETMQADEGVKGEGRRVRLEGAVLRLPPSAWIPVLVHLSRLARG